MSIWNPNPSRPSWIPPMSFLYPVGQRPEGVVDTCHVEPYTLGEKGSRAFKAITRDWQQLIAQVVDDVHRGAFECEHKIEIKKVKEVEGQHLLGSLSTLKYESAHNRVVTKIVDDGQSDVAYWDHWFSRLPKGARWLDLTYHAAECYLHRRIRSLFLTTKHWKEYDPFSRRKSKTLEDDSTAIYQITKDWMDCVMDNSDHTLTDEELESTFSSLCKIGLFPNVLTTLAYSKSLLRLRSEDRSGSERRITSLDQKILVNQTSQAFKALKEAQKSNETDRHIHIFLSTGSVPLLTDLILSTFLLDNNLATKVTLHTWAIPFSNHCTGPDVIALLDHMLELAKRSREHDKETSAVNVEAQSVEWFYDQAQEAMENEKIILSRAGSFSAPFPYWHMHNCENTLYEKLQAGTLTILKGDYHYRKLVCDAKWPPQRTTLQEAAGSVLGSESDINFLALRAIESDVLIDCSDATARKAEAQAGAEASAKSGAPEGSKERERAEAKAKAEWKWGGEWGVVQFFRGSDEEGGK